jgi:hypothetical protein
MKTLKARFDGAVLIPLDPVDLPTDRVLEIDVREETLIDGLPRGSPALLLRAMHDLPHLQPGDIEALEQAIEEGKMPVRYDGVFDKGE